MDFSALFLTIAIVLLATALIGALLIRRRLSIDHFQRAYQASYPPTAIIQWLSRPNQRPLKALIYKPTDWQPKDRRPLVALFFGGGWRWGSLWQFAPMAAKLQAQGAIVILPEYRIKSRDQTGILEAIEDSLAFRDYLAASIHTLGIDPERIILGGGSAGGHLALWSTIGHLPQAPNASKTPLDVAALLLFNPAVNFSQDLKAAADYSLRQKFAARTLAKQVRFDPMAYLSHDHPDALILHGDADQLIPVDKILGYGAALESHGVNAQIKIYPGRGHAFFNLTRSQADFIDTYQSTLAFLNERNLLPTPKVVS